MVFVIAIELVIMVVAIVFVFKLAMTVFGTGLGITLGILAIIPYVSLVILLIVNHRATRTLQGNGIHVGLLGANMRDLLPQ